jgi:rhomboid protease GluP
MDPEPRPPPAEEVLAITPDMLAPGAKPSETRIDFERGLSYAPKLTLLLMVANVVLFIIELANGALASPEAIIRAGALHRESVLQGEVWRAVSAMFLHGGFDHLLGNCLVLYIVGMACEHAVGWRAAAVYFVSGLCGSLLSLLASPGPSVGASGAIFGFTGALIVFLYRHRHVFFIREKRTGVVLAVWAGYQIAVGFLTPYVDNFAHIGGLIGGAACMWPMRARVRLLDRGHAPRGRKPCLE